MTTTEQMQWTIYYAAICSMQYHPGAGTKEHRKLSLNECALVASEMVRITRTTAAGETKCPSQAY